MTTGKCRALGGTVAIDEGHVRVCSKQGCGCSGRDHIPSRCNLSQPSECVGAMSDEVIEKASGEPYARHTIRYRSSQLDETQWPRRSNDDLRTVNEWPPNLEEGSVEGKHCSM